MTRVSQTIRPMIADRRDIKPLTSLRAFAAFAVFLHHVFMLPGLSSFSVGSLGRSGVTLFFVLSGFIIAHSYWERDWAGEFGANARAFYWNRFARIFPLHWAVFLFALPLGLNSNTARVEVAGFPFLLTLTDMLWPWANWGFQPAKVAWTLSCEFLFYLVSPFVLLFLVKRGANALGASILLLFCCACAVILLAVAFPALNWTAYLRVPEFLLGVAAYLVARSRDWTNRAGLIVAAGLVLMILTRLADEVWMLRFYFLADAAGAVLIVFGLAHVSGRLETFMSVGWLVLLGHASFAFYLLHDPFLRYCKVLLDRSNRPLEGAWMLVVPGLLLGLITLASILSYKFFENPVRLRLREFIRKRSRPMAVRPEGRSSDAV